MADSVLASHELEPLVEKFDAPGPASFVEVPDFIETPRYEDYPLPFLTTVLGQFSSWQGIEPVSTIVLGANGVEIRASSSHIPPEQVKSVLQELQESEVPMLSRLSMDAGAIVASVDVQKLEAATLGLIEKHGNNYGSLRLGRLPCDFIDIRTSGPEAEDPLGRLRGFCGIDTTEASSEDNDNVYSLVSIPTLVVGGIAATDRQTIHSREILMLALMPIKVLESLKHQDPGVLQHFLSELIAFRAHPYFERYATDNLAIDNVIHVLMHLVDSEDSP